MNESIWYRLQVIGPGDSLIEEVWAKTWDEMIVVIGDKINQLEQVMEVTWKLSRRCHNDKK